ncbi:MAG: hypothetical protein HQ557_11790 [Bacteroidetes bacterium]|nr:hypothetical protein [Bacteroidota bacterium]
MLTLNLNNVSKVTFGIKFQRNFRMFDFVGSALHETIFSKYSPFSLEYFPHFSSNHSNGDIDARLFSKDKNTFIRFSTSDVIFSYNINEEESFEGVITWLINDALKFIIEQIIKENKIDKIIRFGYMLEFNSEEPTLIDNIISKYQRGVELNKDFHIRYNYTLPTNTAFQHETDNSYINIIEQIIKKVDTNELKFTFDSQYLFEPFKDRIDDWHYKRFIEYINNEYINDFFSFLSKED